MNLNDLRMSLKAALDNMWARIDARIHAIEEGGGGGQDNVIEAISFNGTNVPPDADKRVSLEETDPTVPAWAKAVYKPSYTAAEVGAIPAAQKGAASGVAELDASGRVPSSQLPSYVDDVLEYSTQSEFPATGEAGKIYVARDTNTTYRWTGSAYVEISPSLALGETSSTAYRGDHGKIAYDHAQARGNAYASGLYLIQTNAEGHVIAATPVDKADITALGIPAQDTTYSNATQGTSGLMSAADKSKLDGIESGAQVNSVTGVKGDAESSYRQGNVNLTPANIGAVAKSGDTMTGPLTINSDIIQTSGSLKGEVNDYTNHALKLGHYGDNVMQFFEYGGQFDFIKTTSGSNTTLFQIKNGVSAYPLPINNGGTGATTAAVTITNDYSSVLNAINAVKGTRIFPISIQKNGTASYSDMPSGYETTEWNMLLIGDSIRITALMFIFYGTSSNNQVFSRKVFGSAWDSEWSQIK